MTNKARKHIRLGALMMAIAVVGALAALIVLTNGPGAAQAHDPGNLALHQADCPSTRHDNVATAVGEPTCAQELAGVSPTTPTPTTPTPTAPTPTAPPAGGGTTVATGDELSGMVHNLMVVPHEVAVGGIPQEQLVVTWDPPTEGGVPSGYRIDLSMDGERWLSYMTSTDTRQLRVVYGDETNRETNEAPLMAGTTRYFRVFPMNGMGFGPGVSASGVTSPSWAPEPPMDVTATALNQTTIQVNWKSPEDPPGAPVTSTRIEWSPDGQDPWFLVTDEGPAHGPYNDGSLVSMTTRHYRVFSRNSVGLSPVSVNSDSAITFDSVVPQRPEVLEYILLSPNSSLVDLKWMPGNPPGEPDGDPVSKYIIQARLSGSGNDYKSLHTGPYIDAEDVVDGYDFAETDLARADITFDRTATEGTMVDLRIRAGNRRGYSVDWMTVDNVPIGHAKLPRRQGNPSATQDVDQNAGRTGLDVEWPSARFIKTYEPSGASGDTYADRVSYVLAINGAEEADADSSRMGMMAGSLMTGADRDHVGADGTVQMTNDDALSAGTPRSYKVYPVRDYRDLGVHTGSTLFRVNGLAGGAHILRGFPSEVVTATTAAALLPGQPTDLLARAGGHTEIDLSWAEPAIAPNCAAGANGTTSPNVRMGMVIRAGGENDGSECGPNVITGYHIQMSEDPNLAPDSWDETADTAGAGTTHTWHGLMPDMRYYYRVFTVNATGTSRKAAEYDSTKTDVADPPTPPGGLVAQMREGSNVVDLCWFEHNKVDPLTGDAILDDALPIVGYKITFMDADGEMVEDYTEGTETVYTDETGLAAETTRTYRVYSINLDGVGVEYAEASVTAPEMVTPPNTPPMAVGTMSDVAVKVGETETSTNAVSMYFEDADAGDTLGYDASSSDDMAATAMITADGMISVTGVSAGTATITVTATDMAGEMVTQMFMVTVTEVLTAPTNVRTNPVGSGIVLVSWDSVAGAAGYSLIATNLTDPSAPTRTAAASADAVSGQIQNLTTGDEYLIFVGSFNEDLEFELSDYVKITAE